MVGCQGHGPTTPRFTLDDGEGYIDEPAPDGNVYEYVCLNFMNFMCQSVISSIAPAPSAAVISADVDTSPPHGLETDQFAYRPPSREGVLEFTPRGVRYGVTVRSDR